LSEGGIFCGLLSGGLLSRGLLSGIHGAHALLQLLPNESRKLPNRAMPLATENICRVRVNHRRLSSAAVNLGCAAEVKQVQRINSSTAAAAIRKRASRG